MSYTFKLARRTARLRATALSIALIGAIACNAEEANAPVPESDPADVTSVIELGGPELATGSTAAGVPFGDFHLTSYNYPYTGALIAVYPDNPYSKLSTARSAAARVIISMAGAHSLTRNADNTFSLSKWKARVDLYRKYSYSSYITDGTVLGHYLVDEPFCAPCWGGKTISTSTLEEMARYSKSIWPSLPTGVRLHPSALPSTFTYRYLDFAWAQWEGKLHYPTYGMTAQQYRDRETSAAKARGLGLVFGLNYLDGGDGSSGINGTYYKDPNLSDGIKCVPGASCYRYAMSAAEVKSVGSVLAAASYGCALLSWKSNSTFDSRTGMMDAKKYVAGVAKNRSRFSCKQ